MKRQEVVTLPPGDKVVDQNVDRIVIERELPPLTYDQVEDNLKHLQGQILTVIEASMADDEQRKAAKSLIKGFVNDKLTWMFDLYGHTSSHELPNYDK